MLIRRELSFIDDCRTVSVFSSICIYFSTPFASGSEGIDDGNTINITRVRGKPVLSVFGTTPLEAWANALVKLGLIDEIMYEKALKSIASARVEGINEVKDKMEALRRQRQEARARQAQKQKGLDTPQSPTASQNGEEGEDAMDGEGLKRRGDNHEPATEEEKELRRKVKKLLHTYERRMKESQMTAISLADARINAMGTFLSNPFYGDEVQQKTWLTTVVKKEKSKMGSTGNKRKIVTPTDILDRNASFFNMEIERLLEGLPGTEFCGDYVFYDLRGSTPNHYALAHEAKARKEREKQKKKKKAKEKEVKDTAERERELKRKAREDERENRKKQRLEELDQQKKQTMEER